MSASETTPADLGALIETYRPVEQGFWSALWQYSAVTVSCFGLVFIGLFVILTLIPLVLAGTVKPEWINYVISVSGVLAGLIAFAFILISVVSVLEHQMAARQGFHVDIHENGFCVYERGTTKFCCWPDIKDIRTYTFRGVSSHIIIRKIGEPPFEIPSTKLPRIQQCGQELEKRWRASQKGAWMFDHWNFGA